MRRGDTCDETSAVIEQLGMHMSVEVATTLLKRLWLSMQMRVLVYIRQIVPSSK